VALAFLIDPDVVEVIVDHRVTFVTTSAGTAERFTPILKAEGITVFHVVPNLKSALKAVAAGVDGLVVEGGEGGEFKNPDLVTTMVLIPLIRDHINLPIGAVGGIRDGRGMAAAFALGADGVQMGTRFVASTEAGVHANWKQAIVASGENDTVVLSPNARQSVRTMKTARTKVIAAAGPFDLGEELSHAGALYHGGDMEGGIAVVGPGLRADRRGQAGDDDRRGHHGRVQRDGRRHGRACRPIEARIAQPGMIGGPRPGAVR
jgi:enoyl-[acyl-carrier protein] reductase II